MSAIRAQQLVKSCNGTAVLNGVSLEVAGGEVLFVLGPSGAGKTLLLRAIAGFVPLENGRVWLDDTDVTAVPPHQRGVAMVFQNNALWPHLSVRENVAFALEQQRRKPEEIRGAVHAALAAFSLDGLGDRRPAELTGGEQQRVALARALAAEPGVLLLDEPFSQVEVRTRRQLFATVRQWCRVQGVALVCVTQHIADALAVADRVAVLVTGMVQQEGTPLEVYRRPQTRFVGEFLSDANVITGTVLHAGAGEFVATTPLGEVRGALADAAREPEAGMPLDIVIRPESLHLDTMSPDENAFPGEPSGGDYGGGVGRVFFQTRAGPVLRVLELNPRTDNGTGGGTVFAWVAPEDVTGIPLKPPTR